MALDPQNIAQIRDRELRVWDLLLKGLELNFGSAPKPKRPPVLQVSPIPTHWMGT